MSIDIKLRAYPITLLPEPIVHARHEAMPPLPPYELPPVPKKPREPKEPEGTSRALTVPLFVGLLVALAFPLPVITFLVVLALLVTGWAIMHRWAEVDNHRKEVAAWQLYEADLSKYVVEKMIAESKQELDKVLLWTAKAVQAYRDRLVAETLAAVPAPYVLHPSSRPRTGVSELWFYKRLQECFGDLVMRGATIDLENSFCDQPYVPDFVYYDPQRGVAIDIEIDEPYRLDTKEPIHVAGIDDDRNEFFVSNGWAVVRFAEAQVLAHPAGCCQVIARVADRIATGDTDKPKARMQRVDQWTAPDALLAAGNRLREKMLIERDLLIG